MLTGQANFHENAVTDFVSAPLTPARIEWQNSTPASPFYGDSYYMAGMGVEESSTVFLQASRLKQRFASLPPNGLFVIGETGFGTGLNALLAAQCFVEHAPPAARLHFVSAERSEEHTSELQSRGHLVCRLLLEKKKYEDIDHIERAAEDVPDQRNDEDDDRDREGAGGDPESDRKALSRPGTEVGGMHLQAQQTV